MALIGNIQNMTGLEISSVCYNANNLRSKAFENKRCIENMGREKLTRIDDRDFVLLVFLSNDSSAREICAKKNMLRKKINKFCKSALKTNRTEINVTDFFSKQHAECWFFLGRTH